MAEPAPQSAQPPEIEREIAFLVKSAVRHIDAQRCDTLWQAYMCARIAQALLQEYQVRLLESVCHQDED